MERKKERKKHKENNWGGDTVCEVQYGIQYVNREPPCIESASYIEIEKDL